MKRGIKFYDSGGVRVDRTVSFNSEQEGNSENGEGDNSLEFVQNLRELDGK